MKVIMQKIGVIAIFIVALVGMVCSGPLVGCSAKYNPDMTDKIKGQQSKISVSRVGKKHDFKHVGNIEVMCLSKEKITTVAMETSAFTIQDSSLSVFEQIGYAIKSSSNRKMLDYYLHGDCVRELIDACSIDSPCMSGNKSRADCHTRCNLYDIMTAKDRGNGAPFNNYDIYGIEIP